MIDSQSKMFFYILETPLPCILMLTGAARIIYQVWNNKRRLLAAHMYVIEVLQVWDLQVYLRSTTLFCMTKFLLVTVMSLVSVMLQSFGHSMFTVFAL